MMAESEHHQRDVNHSRFRDNAFINQGNVQGSVHYHPPPPHQPARAEAVRVIPYPRNEDMVRRRELIERLDELLPQTSGSYSAALWGLGGSGKTQIALDYAYRQCDDDGECCVFWVHADNEASFTSDYKAIGKCLGVDKWLEGSDLLEAVCSKIRERSRWVMILDNADDLGLFGVGPAHQGMAENLRKYVPYTSQGITLWTSRDAHIAGTLVGAGRGIEVPSMEADEAATLLARVRDDKLTFQEVDVDTLLKELQHLPLAISQAGAYMRRTSMSSSEYLSLLAQGRTRWEVLKISDADRHRRPEVSNSVLETWRISIERIREESEISYRMLHVVAYMDSQDIPDELLAAAGGYSMVNEDPISQATDIMLRQAIVRLVEFSFLNMRRKEDGGCSYEMHKLVQEAIRYGLRAGGLIEAVLAETTGREGGEGNGEAYYSRIGLQVLDELFPKEEGKPWARSEQYTTHVIRVGEWAEVNRTETDTARLLSRASGFLYNQGRWREKEPVDRRAWKLRREALGDKHPDTIRSMASLATTYHMQGRYDEAEGIYREVLDLRREVVGDKHPDTIRSMASLGATYHEQGRYDEAEGICREVLDLRREVLRDKHPDTISSMADLGATYHTQGRYDEAEELKNQALDLRREALGDKHPDTIQSMASLAATYHAQGRYDEAEGIFQEILDLQREVLRDKHPDTIQSMANLATTYHTQGRYDEAEELKSQALDLRREALGDKHPDTIQSMASLAATYHAQGRYDEAATLHQTALDLRREVLGEYHPHTVRSTRYLASTQESLRQIRSL